MYQNPILYADYSDPDVIRVGQDFYMVASSFTYLPGVPLLHSKDLVHWEIINYCVSKLPFDKYNRPSHGSGTWAPSIRYHDDTFIVFIPLPDEGIMVARSKDPYGQFQLNMLCASKGWIDPCPIWDDDGRAYMVYALARSRCGIKHRLMLVEIDPECTRLIGEPMLIFDGEQVAPTTEGPKIYKKDDYYYILMPSGGVATGWQSCLRSRDIHGPYEYKVVMHQGCTDINGPHQGGWVDTPDGRNWFVHFQDVHELGRITHLQPMCFINGWPFIGSDLDGDGIGEPVKEWSDPVEGAPEYKISTSDDFRSDKLGLQWQWQANPNEDWYQLDDGHLILYCMAPGGRENLLWYAGNVLTQIPQSKAFTVTTSIHLYPGEDGDIAACGIVGHKYSYAGIKRMQGKNFVVMFKGDVTKKEFEGEATETSCDAQLIDSGHIFMKIVVREDNSYNYYYSLDGVSYKELGKTQMLERATWTGAKICLWSANMNNKGSGNGYGRYDWVYITDDTAKEQ
jgi:beta-xylosidase|nr:glycoside hydrolase 43 family protein [Butyrivibrio sp.]